MTDNKVFKLMDLVEEIKNLDNIIHLHQANDSESIMLSQYHAKKIKLLGFLIDELNLKSETSIDGFLIIKKLLEKFIIESEIPSIYIKTEKTKNLNMLANSIN